MKKNRILHETAKQLALLSKGQSKEVKTDRERRNFLIAAAVLDKPITTKQVKNGYVVIAL